MNSGRLGVFVLVGLGIVIAGLALFTVDERDLAIKLRVGEVVTADYEPCLQWKWPIIETVAKFPRRILTSSESRPERVFTQENESLDVDFFVKYRIVDAVRFYTSTGGSLPVADQRLAEIVKNAVVTEFGERTVAQAISLQRAELMSDILDKAKPTAADLGVDLIDFRVKKVEFMEDVSNSVYLQMEAERARIATERRSEGRGNAERKRAEADRERTIILANAYRDGQKVRGEGDAKAAEIYASAYTRNAEFYAFYRSINAYKRSMGKPGDLLVVDPNNEFFRYLNQSDGKQ